MSILSRFRRKKTEDEAARTARLRRTGRIAEGIIIDISDDESGNPAHIFYSYSIGGIDYESSQPLDEEQRSQPANYAPGTRVVIRYDPHQPGNSVVV
ncbi:MAG: DUF3592 domain-containing protein [Pyrinomonadaceae bacterium]